MKIGENKGMNIKTDDTDTHKSISVDGKKINKPNNKKYGDKTSNETGPDSVRLLTFILKPNVVNTEVNNINAQIAQQPIKNIKPLNVSPLKTGWTKSL